ncbi:hypothetical protein SBRY_10660 [Actinacidiphila bryophytorum]|uniref:Uncharacterized protein n=1 Tax=Actinacidiphila bryophytorum TaxID=1436133 RepID=A0A9W4E1R9_9ACTN|nr:hypothetical protein SBRY_10660 [Actinacidiphila bryophytorum]
MPLLFGSCPGTEILGAGIDDAALPREMSPIEEERQRDLRHRAALCRRQGQGVHRRVPGRLHLRGRSVLVHPPGRMCRLRRVRTGLPG